MFLCTDKGLPPSATGPGAEGQPGPPWVAVTRQKRRGAPEQPANQQDKPGAQTLKSETGKQAKGPERAQVSKHFLSLSMQERAASWGWGLGPLEDSASCTIMVIIEPMAWNGGCCLPVACAGQLGRQRSWWITYTVELALSLPPRQHSIWANGTGLK